MTCGKVDSDMEVDSDAGPSYHGVAEPIGTLPSQLAHLCARTALISATTACAPAHAHTPTRARP